MWFWCLSWGAAACWCYVAKCQLSFRRAQNAAILDMSMHPELQTKLLERIFFHALGPYLHCNPFELFGCVGIEDD